MDETYLWFCVRYVERNRIRAGLVECEQDYPWSSAKAHCGLRRDDVPATKSPHGNVFEGISRWIRFACIDDWWHDADLWQAPALAGIWTWGP